MPTPPRADAARPEAAGQHDIEGRHDVGDAHHGRTAHDGNDAHGADDRSPSGAARHRRPLTLAAVGAIAVAGILGLATLLVGDDAIEHDPPPLDVWAPYWVLDASAPQLAERAGTIRELSPFWYAATAADVVGLDPQAPAALVEDFLATARSNRMTVVPSIVDAMPAGGMAAVLADPGARAVHVDTLVAFAAAGDFAGLDLDYEKFAFADGRDTWATTRPNWVAFVTELAARLHADNRTLTVSVPPVYDDGQTDASGYWVYDYAAMAVVVDRIRVMAYDYSPNSVGSIAPLDWVRRAIDGVKEASGAPEKLVLGVPIYGYNWPVTTTGTCPPGLAEGRTPVTPRTVDELLERRGATPAYDPEAGEWSFRYDLVLSDATTSCTQHREARFVDAAGAQERIEMARDAGLGGVAVWALGYDDAATWSTIVRVVTPSTSATSTVTSTVTSTTAADA